MPAPGAIIRPGASKHTSCAHLTESAHVVYADAAHIPAMRTDVTGIALPSLRILFAVHDLVSLTESDATIPPVTTRHRIPFVVGGPIRVDTNRDRFSFLGGMLLFGQVIPCQGRDCDMSPPLFRS